MSADFISGVLAGFIFASFFGFVMAQIQKARNVAGAPNRPQTVMIPTGMTPRQVMAAAFRATMAVIGWVIILATGSWLFIALMFFGA